MEKNKAIIYLSEKGREIAEKIRSIFPEAKLYKFKKELLHEIWNKYNAFIFVSAIGVTIRCIASFIKNKKEDPAIIVIDEEGKNVIPLLGGHSAEANSLSLTIASFIKANPVITTASDLKNLPAIDLWIKKTGLKIKNPFLLPKIMAKFNSSKELKIFLNTQVKLPFPKHFSLVSTISEADIIVTNKFIKDVDENNQLVLIPKNLFVGVGFHDWIKEEDLEKTLKEVFKEAGFYWEALSGIATIQKKGSHPALKKLSERYKIKLFAFTSKELNQVKSLSPPGASMKTLGVASVSEQAALFSAFTEFQKAFLCVPKQVFKDLTIAIAEGVYKIKGKLYIVGTGPGDLENLTPKAISILRSSDFIVGYKTYINLIKPLIEDKEILAYGMKEEVERAKIAIKKALEGNVVSLISGGDPGIYGMAGLVLEILSKNSLDLEIEIIPGISALNACASLAGAPLMNDFVAISLSDRLTPWDVIEKRLHLAGKGDFVIVLYNPKSKGRKEHLSKAKNVLLSYRKSETPVAIIKEAFRKNQEIILTTLKKIDLYPIDMQTTIIIGNSNSFIFKNWLITPRGYEVKYGEKLQFSSTSLG